MFSTHAKPCLNYSYNEPWKSGAPFKHKLLMSAYKYIHAHSNNAHESEAGLVLIAQGKGKFIEQLENSKAAI